LSTLNMLTILVQSFSIGFLDVAKALGLHFSIDKGSAGPGVRAASSCAAALIGVVGENLSGNVIILSDNGAFTEIVRTMSGGAISEPHTSDPMSMSALGELTNMLCGSALKEVARAGSGRLDITPPQLFSGENLKSVPSEGEGVKYFTIPLVSQSGECFVYIVLGFR
jgi:chemotaxis protein CheX